MLTYNERLELLLECKKKKIRQKTLAELTNTTSSWICQWFGNPDINLSERHEIKIIEYIQNH